MLSSSLGSVEDSSYTGYVAKLKSLSTNLEESPLPLGDTFGDSSSLETSPFSEILSIDSFDIVTWRSIVDPGIALFKDT